MLLTSDEHYIGRLVDEARFQIIAPAVSARHCKIFRKSTTSEATEHQSDNSSAVFLKDSRLIFFSKCSIGGGLIENILMSLSFSQHEWDIFKLGEVE